MPCPHTLEEWESETREIAAIAYQSGNDPFLSGLLTSIHEELGREYQKEQERKEEAKCG